MAISAKVVCTGKMQQGAGNDHHAMLTFGPDYQDGRNKEWAYYTPGLSLTMTVRGQVADHFNQGERYTLLLEPEHEQESTPCTPTN